jgi:hypothetical protein
MWNNRCHCLLSAIAVMSFCLTGMSHAALAQSQSDSAPSVAEAARRAREQKKHDAKPVHTFTNEDLPAAPPSSPNGMSSAASPAKSEDADVPAERDAREAPATVAAVTAANDEQSKQKKAENAAALERAKKQLALAEKEFDVMQRKFALDSDSFYSKADFASDKEGQAALDAEAQQINDQRNAVEALKARVAELQALVGEQENPEPEKKPASPSEK